MKDTFGVHVTLLRRFRTCLALVFPKKPITRFGASQSEKKLWPLVCAKNRKHKTTTRGFQPERDLVRLWVVSLLVILGLSGTYTFCATLGRLLRDEERGCRGSGFRAPGFRVSGFERAPNHMAVMPWVESKIGEPQNGFSTLVNGNKLTQRCGPIPGGRKGPKGNSDALSWCP